MKNMYVLIYRLETILIGGFIAKSELLQTILVYKVSVLGSL